ncbi:hypothetical protein oki361_14630 [Helicobacter pylori]
MKSEAMKLLDFIGENQEKQFVIPIYQRVYSWEKEQCKQLWDDIVKTGGNDQMNGHFIGSIVFVYSTDRNKLLIIDGHNKDSPLSRFYSPL